MNRLMKNSWLIALLLVSPLAFGQEKMTNEEIPYIEVNGTAEEEVIPDEIFIEIVIDEKSTKGKGSTVEEQEKMLITALRSLKIDLDNLSLSDTNADYVRVNWKKKEVLTSKDYILKVGDAETVGRVFQELNKIGITEARIVRVNHSRMDELRKMVRIRAIQAAKEKADYMLEAIGEETGKALIIREQELMNMPAQYSNSLAGNVPGIISMRNVSDKKDDSSILFEKIKVKITIYAKFAIK